MIFYFSIKCEPQGGENVRRARKRCHCCLWLQKEREPLGPAKGRIWQTQVLNNRFLYRRSDGSSRSLPPPHCQWSEERLCDESKGRLPGRELARFRSATAKREMLWAKPENSGFGFIVCICSSLIKYMCRKSCS